MIDNTYERKAMGDDAALGDKDRNEWSSYGREECVINSKNNEIDKRSLAKYLNHLKEMELMNNDHELKISNVVDFSFQYSHRSEHNTKEHMNSSRNHNNNKIIPSSLSSQKNDCKDLVHDFISDVFGKCHSTMRIEPCDYVGDIQQDKNESEPLKSNETAGKNKEEQIEELQEKLNTYKFQNRIINDENKKLLEVIHLFKMISYVNEREKKKSNTIDNTNTFYHNHSNSTGSTTSASYHHKKIGVKDKSKEKEVLETMHKEQVNQLVNELSKTIQPKENISNKIKRKRIEIDNKQYISTIKTKEAKYGDIHSSTKKANTSFTNTNVNMNSINSYKSKQSTNNNKTSTPGKNGYKTYINISNCSQVSDKIIPCPLPKPKAIPMNHKEMIIQVPKLFQIANYQFNPSLRQDGIVDHNDDIEESNNNYDNDSLIDVERRLMSFASGKDYKGITIQPNKNNDAEKMLSLLNEDNNNKVIGNNTTIDNDIKSKLGLIKTMTETATNTIDVTKAPNPYQFFKKKEETIISNNNTKNQDKDITPSVHTIVKETIAEKPSYPNIIPYHLINPRKIYRNIITHSYRSIYH